MSVDPNQAKSIFLSAVEDHAPADWSAYLDKACGGDADLRRRVEALLAAHQGKDRLFDDPRAVLIQWVDISESPEAPGTVIGRYKLLEKIGEGGMAVVYMAEQEQPLRRKVALKIIKLGMDTRQVIARFEAERQALALMDHPCIAKVLDAGATETGRPYFVMELVQGVSITEYCDRNSLSTKERLRLFLLVCQAVQHAHQKGIIHRDLKPSNIMVTRHDGQPLPKVIDFGIAKAINQKLTEKTLFTRYAHLIGTPAYMSPEQAELNDLDIDTRSDIYSLGVLLYELLTGTTPFSEEELRKAGYLEMQRVIREQAPVKPSTRITALGDTSTEIAKRRSSTPELLRKTIRRDLDWIVMKSLEKDRTHRYETASALALDVQRHLASEPVLARAPSAAYRTRKFLRRHRSQVLIAMMMAIVVTLAAVLLLQWNRDRQRLKEAQNLHDRGTLSQAREQYAQADRKAALETLQLIPHGSSVEPEARLLQAGILVDDRRFEEAKTLVGTLLNERREVAGAAYSLLARILWESEALGAEKLGEIEKYRQKAEELLPRTAEAYFLRAMTAVTIREQLAALEKALDPSLDTDPFDPMNYECRRLRAFIYYASRQYDQLREDAIAMTVLRPRDPLGYSLRAIASRELGKHANAIAEYEAAMKRLASPQDPQYADLALQRCEVFLRMEDYQRVIAEAGECLASWPDRPSLRYYIFGALTAIGDYDEASTVFRQIINPGEEARRPFQNWCAKYVFDTLQAGRSWHPEALDPVGPAFLAMVEADEIYRELAAKGRPVITNGFSAQWSPDGQKLAFSMGVEGYSGVAVFDLATGQTELLIVPGKYPKWSPDGQYIAFARDREFLRVPEFLSADSKNPLRPGADEEIWFMKSDGSEPRRLARGVWPSWSRDSSCVYYRLRADNTLYSISVTGEDIAPKRITACPGYFPSLSPDNERVAYVEGTSLKVENLVSPTLVAQCSVPWPSASGWGPPAWSPTGEELCLGGSGGLEDRTGLWIYHLGHGEPAQTLDGPITAASWATDGTKLVFELGAPHFEIWTMDLAPNVSTVETLGPARTGEQHLRDLLTVHTRRIEADPTDASAYASRARCYDYLHDRARADADMKGWSAVMSGRSPLDLVPASVDLAFGELVDLDSVIPFLNDAYVECLSFDGREMFICSWRPQGCGGTDIWVLKRSSADKDWAPPENLGEIVNSAGTDAACCISADGLELYFNSERSGGHGHFDLYVARRATLNSPWGQVENLGPKVNSLNLDAFPCLSADGSELYFMSARPSGYGAYDLYVSQRAATGDPWGNPANLGPMVNSPYCETCPCLSADGLRLFFQDYQTPRPGGYGGGDIWVARRTSRSDPWGLPVNLGPKINGFFFDHRPCLAPDGSALYFARQSGGVLTRWKVPIIHTANSDLNYKAKGKED